MNKSTRLWLAAAGLAAVIAIHAVLALVLSRQMTAGLLAREGEVTQEFLSGILAASGDPENLFAEPAPSPELSSFATHIKTLPGIIRANIYAPDGFIRHSTEANLMGLQFKDNMELTESFAGHLVAKIEDASSASKDERLGLGRMPGEQFVEAYVPVKAPDGKVVAVVEFYRDAGRVQAAVASATRTIWLAAAASALILFLALAGTALLGRRLYRP